MWGRKADEMAPRNQYKAKENATRHYASTSYVFHIRQCPRITCSDQCLTCAHHMQNQSLTKSSRVFIIRSRECLFFT